jgi:hypothetical protein
MQSLRKSGQTLEAGAGGGRRFRLERLGTLGAPNGDERDALRGGPFQFG